MELGYLLRAAPIAGASNAPKPHRNWAKSGTTFSPRSSPPTLPIVTSGLFLVSHNWSELINNSSDLVKNKFNRINVNNRICYWSKLQILKHLLWRTFSKTIILIGRHRYILQRTVHNFFHFDTYRYPFQIIFLMNALARIVHYNPLNSCIN